VKILVIGSGGREHALAFKIKQSPHVSEVFVAPGNGGMETEFTCVPIKTTDFKALIDFVKSKKIDLTVVGPEEPLVKGIVDQFESEGLAIFGPNQMASQFEGSKDFTKSFLSRHGIASAPYQTFQDKELNEAYHHVGDYGYPVVIKADGLAAGKGVIIAQNEDEAKQAIKEMMTDKVFGQAGSRVVIEKFLKGYEASILCFVDGETILPMQPAQDYKKAYDGDLGLNTGGMGTYSPSEYIALDMMNRIQNEILDPFIKGIKSDGIHFKGILFVGLMIDGDDIYVLEYNVRLGDPETEVTLPRLKNDIVDVMEAVLLEKLSEVTLTWTDQHAVCVIMASGGYPEKYEKGKPITGLERIENAKIYHCGTALKSGALVTNGGRVLGVTALSDTLDEARLLAYKAVEKINFDGAQYRNDIGLIVE